MKWSKKRNAQHRATFNRLKGALQSLRFNLPLSLSDKKPPYRGSPPLPRPLVFEFLPGLFAGFEEKPYLCRR